MDLLKCVVCPKQPSFSDISHLLTHVSSKGHLAHLHKLQVRSHQEVEAGYRLGSYNQWYQQNGVAGLLSERMQQKEAKQASKRTGNQRRVGAAVKYESQMNLDPNILSCRTNLPVRDRSFQKHPSQSTLRSRRRVMQEEMNDPDFVAVLPFEDAESSLNNSMATNDFSAHQLLTLSSRTPFVQSSPETYYNPLSASVEDVGEPYVHYPEHTKLKGTIWPGMTMFDAATLEMQKKRNQRKDGSILKYMKANSAMIEPVEITYSPGGTLKRRRHLDDLDDDVDLLEGETSIKRQPVRSKRKSRIKVLPNTSRRNLRKSDTTHKPPSNKSVSISSSTRPDSPPLASQRVHYAVCSSGRDSASRARPELLSCHSKRGNVFDTYNEESTQMPRGALPDDLSSPFLNGIHGFDAPNESNMLLAPANWLQSDTVYNQTYDPFRDYRSVRMTIPHLSGVRPGKENKNPLSWKHESLDERTINPFQTLDSRFHDFEGDLGSLSAVYAYNKNPLVDDLVYDGRNTADIRGMR